MPPLNPPARGQDYWRSLEDLADTPEFRRFVEDEFAGLTSDLLASPTRRQFIKLMGASLGLTGLAACRWPKEPILPYADRPKNRVPGVAVQYATAMEMSGGATGLLVTSYDGRPIKVDGNHQHPFSRGKTNAFQQASILELYDPDRRCGVVRRVEGHPPENLKWADFEAFFRPHFAELRNRGGAGLCVLCEPTSSPSVLDMRRRFLEAFPQALWFEYEPISHDRAREGAKLAFARPYRTHLHLDQADVIVSLGGDFLMDGPAALKYAGGFASRRRAADGTMCRLYAFESTFSVTGAAADHRYPVRPTEVAQIGAYLASALTLLDSGPLPTGLPVPGAVLEAIAKDLREHRGRSIIIVGPEQPAELHALVHHANSALGAIGTTVTYTAEVDPGRPTHAAAIADLCGRMAAGQVQTLVILGGNAGYDAPHDLQLAAALNRVNTTIRAGWFDDETSRLCRWHVPLAHYLESWGDARAWDGTVSLVQPLIEPLYEGRTAAELLALLAGEEASGYEITRRTFRVQFAAGTDFDAAWRKALHEGVVAGTAWPAQMPALQQPPRWEPKPNAVEGFEIAFAPDYRIHDGRFANNGWLQELPDPITKITWDNAALIAPADAERLGVRQFGDMIRIEAGGRKLEIAAFPLPGHAAGAITITLGSGRPAAGRVAAGAGVDAYPLMSGAFGTVLAGAKVSATGQHYRLATTQDHHSIRSAIGDREARRRIAHDIIRETTLAELDQPAPADSAAPHSPQLWDAWKYDQGHKWGLAIDLSTCFGCNACVIACQAENNIPVVGKDEVARGREMQWLRIDRYFKSDAAHASAPTSNSAVALVFQPMTCAHCENAPCEQVCPVNATVHDEEGINVQVYNRCVGTRYCNNNCPLKIRRFNWFWNHHGPKHPLAGEQLTELERMVFNPEVTVRSRGVMEKCTLCMQRISAARIAARVQGRTDIPDNAFTTACAQACPTDAIVFGDLNDPLSCVRKLHEHPRAYELFEDLNLRARLRYLARLRNPHREA